MQYINFSAVNRLQPDFSSPSFSIKYVLYFLYFYSQWGYGTAGYSGDTRVFSILLLGYGDTHYRVAFSYACPLATYLAQTSYF
jgi:hypothetical protein